MSCGICRLYKYNQIVYVFVFDEVAYFPSCALEVFDHRIVLGRFRIYSKVAVVW